jgi:hypothetical protein
MQTVSNETFVFISSVLKLLNIILNEINNTFIKINSEFYSTFNVFLLSFSKKHSFSKWTYDDFCDTKIKNIMYLVQALQLTYSGVKLVLWAQTSPF